MGYALVTGGTKGIGKSIVHSLLQRGYYVVTTYCTDEMGRKDFDKDMEQYRSQYVVCRYDLSELTNVYRLVEQVKNIVPRLDCIVCNAGETVRKNFKDTTDEDWLRVMNVSVNSNFVLIRELFNYVDHQARILFIGSLMGVHPHARNLAYGVSKAAVHAMALNLVKEFEGTETTVNVVIPGFVETAWQKDKSTEIRENIYKKTALKRFGTAEEIAHACMFCIDNGFVNGSQIEVSGGYNFK